MSGGISRIPIVKYLFIDGAYLDGVVDKFSKDFYQGTPIPLDYSQIGQGVGAMRTFYYHGVPSKLPNDSPEDFERRKESIDKRLSDISMLPGHFVREGVVRGEGKRKRQKKVDILIAVDMLNHTMRNNMERAILLSGDLDFEPLVDALVQAGMHTMIYCEESSASKDLIASADSRGVIDYYTFFGWTTEDFKKDNPRPRVKSTSGTIITADMVPIKTGKIGFDDVVNLYMHDNDYLVVFPDPNHREAGHQLHYWHSDQGFLDRFLRGIGNEINWD